MGAFYVDQKKKGLLPSTLPSEHESEHEQWIYGAIPDNSYYRDFVLPVTLKSRPFVVVPADVFVAAATKINSGFLTYSYGGSTPSSVRIATDTPTISAINAIIVGI